MPQYNCSVIDSRGKKIIVKYDLSSKEAAQETLKQNGYIILDIQETSKVQKDIKINNPFAKVKTKDLAVYCRQLQAMLNAGLPISSCLDIMRVQIENKRLAEVTTELYENLQKGHSFSECLLEHKDVFPDLFINMVQAGEISGNMDLVMKRLAQHFEKENKINNKVKTAMAYPIVLSILCVAIVIFLLVNVLPTFTSLYSSSGAELPALTKILMGQGEFLKTKWYLVISIVILIVVGIKAALNNNAIRQRFDKKKLELPLVKGVAIKVATSRFTRTLSTLIGSGVEMLQAFDIVSRVTGNTYIENKLLEAKNDIKKGEGLSVPIRNTGVFPPMVYSMIKIGEDSGSLDDILEKTADFYDEEVETAVTRLTILLEPMMIIIMAGIIGFIVLAMVLPMFDMVSVVTA